jgi:hypothetical protein
MGSFVEYPNRDDNVFGPELLFTNYASVLEVLCEWNDNSRAARVCSVMDVERDVIREVMVSLSRIWMVGTGQASGQWPLRHCLVEIN